MSKNILTPWWKTFLTSILGTTISIALTFGTTAWVNSSKKKAAQRQTAMMAVYDIDEIIRLVNEAKEKDKTLFEITSYLYTHQEGIDSMSKDSLVIAAYYLVEDPSDIPEWTDDSKEKVFSSGMETRQNLENAQFYDNVQKCYRLRREMMKSLEIDPDFRRPISVRHYEQCILQAEDDEIEHDGSLNEQGIRKLLKEAFKQRTTELYLRKFFLRQKYYAHYADEFARLNRENRFMMDITDKDMAEYIKKNVEKKQTATLKLIIGEWEKQYETGDKFTYNFHQDNTIVLTRQTVNQISVHVVEENMHVPIIVPAQFRIKGHWVLNGDSLKFEYDAETLEMLSLDVDFSRLPKAALERKKDSLEIVKQQIKDHLMQNLRQLNWTWSQKVSFDITGDIMLWENENETLWGKTETETEQLFRKKDDDD